MQLGHGFQSHKKLDIHLRNRKKTSCYPTPTFRHIFEKHLKNIKIISGLRKYCLELNDTKSDSFRRTIRITNTKETVFAMNTLAATASAAQHYMSAWTW